MSPLAVLCQCGQHLWAVVELVEDHPTIPEVLLEKAPLLCKELFCGTFPLNSVLRRVPQWQPGDVHVTAQQERGSLVQYARLCVLDAEELFFLQLGKIFEDLAARALDEASNRTTSQTKLVESGLDLLFEVRACVAAEKVNSFRFFPVVVLFFALYMQTVIQIIVVHYYYYSRSAENSRV